MASKHLLSQFKTLISCGFVLSIIGCNDSFKAVSVDSSSAGASLSLASCSFNGVTLSSGDSTIGYSAATVPYGSLCSSVAETVTCTNGVLSSTSALPTCAVNAAASCTFNGAMLASGASTTGYSAATVPYGSLCSSVAETVTCNNGIIAPANAMASCSVNPAVSGTVAIFSSNSGQASQIFGGPVGITADPSGNFYVADPVANTIIKITSDGKPTTFAGSGQIGSADGTGLAATFNSPYFVVSDGSGNLYVTDSHSNTIRKVTSSAAVTTIAGVAGKEVPAALYYPGGITIDSSGNLKVSDGTGILTFSLAGAFLSSIEYVPTNPAGSIRDVGITSDAAGNLYNIDPYDESILKIAPDGTISTFAQPSGNSYLMDITIDPTGNLYVTDYSNFAIRKITPAGVISTFASTQMYGNPNGIAYVNGMIYCTTSDAEVISIVP